MRRTSDLSETMSDNCCPPTEEKSECCPPQEEEKSACCPPADKIQDCCPEPADDRPGYKLWPFVCGWLDTPVGQTPQVSGTLTTGDIIGRWQMRWGIGRTRYSIAPGLYAIGSPTPDSQVIVSANYKMTFDILRRDMRGYDLWLLILDTKGINVWCAAGKGTFSSNEVIQRVRTAKLDKVVNHRNLIIPQLGAPGVSAHEISKACGFKVIFGPVRSADLPDFLDHGCQATASMRRVTFGLWERLVLTPVELVYTWKQVPWSILVLFILGGIGPDFFSLSAAWNRGGAASLAGLAALFCGAVIVPILLPWLPGQSFSLKGAVAGLACGFFAAIIFAADLDWLNTLALVISFGAISSWFAMHFTGSSTFTSPSGVEKEMRQAIPAQAAALLVSGFCWIAAAFS